MRKLLLGAIAVGALSAGPALAADIAPAPPPAPTYTKAPPPPPLFTWTGFYVGANVGGHWDNDDLTFAADPIGWGAAAAAELDSRAAVSLQPSGVIGGIQGGFNWQLSNIVLGIEADASWQSGSAARSLTFTGAVNFNPADVMTNSTKATFLATVRPRLGIAFDRVLVYATGGVAFGTVETNDTMCTFGCPAGVAGDFAAVSASTTQTGWVAGGGAQFAFSNYLSLRAEYLYVDLGTFSTTIPVCANCAPSSEIVVNHHYTENIARIGFDWRFGP